jgi:hypothetical protein
MRVSLSTLTMLEQAGDTAAYHMAKLWTDEVGFIYQPEYLQVYYRGQTDRFVLYIWNRARAVAPGEWYYPIVNEGNMEERLPPWGSFDDNELGDAGPLT